MKAQIAFAVAVMGLTAASPAMATDLALITNGGSFVAGSSFINATGYSEPIAEMNLQSITPIQAYYNGDSRYIFNGYDSVESLEIAVTPSSSLSSFGASFGATDRTPQSFSVSVSTDGTDFTPVIGSLSTIDSGTQYLLTPTAPVTASYILYTFGPSANPAEGTGVGRVFATSAVPEPSTWAMMLIGMGFVGMSVRRQRRKSAADFALA